MNDIEILEKIKQIKDSERRYELYLELNQDEIKIKAIKYLDYSYFVSAIKELKEDENKISMLTSLETEEEMISVIESLKSNQTKKDYIKKIYKESTSQKDYNITRIIKSIKDEDIQLECLKYIENEITRSSIISNFKSDIKKEQTIKGKLITQDYPLSIVVNSFENESLKPNYLHYFYSELMAIDVIKKIKDDEIKKKFLDGNLYQEHKLTIAETLEFDENKVKYISSPITPANYKLVMSLKSKELKKEYYKQAHDLKIKGLILLSTKDKSFIFEEFEKHNQENTMLLCLTIISNTKDEELKLILINKLNNDLYKKLLLTNSNDKKETLSNIDLKKLKNIDQNITIGVELEVEHRRPHEIVELQTILNNWVIVKEPLIDNGVEIKSPILRNKPDDMKELKYVCNMLEENEFIGTQNCGGHIHLGGNYFEDEKEMAMFYYIFANCENIFINISNRAGTHPRQNINKHAEPIAPQLHRAIKENSFMQIDDIKTFVNMMNSVQGGRAYSINIKNMLLNRKTIEIRCPNIEFNYEELINNIYLYTTLMKKAKEFSHTDDKKIKDKLLKLSNKRITDKEKVKILLDLLFEDEEDKKVYQERFDKNVPRLYKLHHNKNVIYSNLQYPQKRR